MQQPGCTGEAARRSRRVAAMPRDRPGAARAEAAPDAAAVASPAPWSGAPALREGDQEGFQPRPATCAKVPP